MMNGNCDDAIIAALAEALREKSLADVMPGDLVYVHGDRDAEAKWLARVVLSHHSARIRAAREARAQAVKTR
jgi:metallophosphoesterase superfamily enzyme